MEANRGFIRCVLLLSEWTSVVYWLIYKCVLVRVLRGLLSSLVTRTHVHLIFIHVGITVILQVGCCGRCRRSEDRVVTLRRGETRGIALQHTLDVLVSR